MGMMVERMRRLADWTGVPRPRPASLTPCVALAGASLVWSTAAFASCRGRAFYPPDNPFADMLLNGEIAKGRISVTNATLGLDPVQNSLTQTARAVELDMQRDKNVLGVDIGFVQAGSHMNASDVRVTVFYPIKITDAPMVSLTVGQLVLRDVARRDPSMPNLADVYADFPLTGGAAGSLGPGAVIGVKVDDNSGVPLEQASFRLPDAQGWTALLNDARQKLVADCEGGN
jgi:hypothetical protein